MSHAANATQPVVSLLNTVSDFLASIWTAAHQHAELESRLRQMRKLEALSDAELAKHGIKRDRIAHYVFRDIYYV